MDENQVVEEYEAEVEELLTSLKEDIYKLITIISEENSTKVYNTVLETKEDALRAVKTFVGGIILSPANLKKSVKVSAKIVKASSKIAKFSGKFIKVNVSINVNNVVFINIF